MIRVNNITNTNVCLLFSCFSEIFKVVVSGVFWGIVHFLLFFVCFIIIVILLFYYVVFLRSVNQRFIIIFFHSKIH